MCREVKEIIMDFADRDWTLAEKILFGVDCILLGVILGRLLFPRKKVVIKGNQYGCCKEGDAEE
ncbi:hypothetical protein ABXS75_06240 [Roseburia hominis]